MAQQDGGAVWESVKWQDGSTFEGLAKAGTPVRGVLRHASGGRYEGEFGAGQYNSVGVYVWDGGTIYRGAWRDGRMSGCGALLATRGDGSLAVHEGQFVADEFVGSDNGFEGGGGACSAADARAAAAAADAAAATARAYELEPGLQASPFANMEQASAEPSAARSPGHPAKQSAAAEGSPASRSGKPVKRRPLLCRVPMLRSLLTAEDVRGHRC